MKMKVTLLSPVHIGTGEQIPPFCYKRIRNQIFCYSQEAILSSLDQKQLIQAGYLSRLFNGVQNKRVLYDSLSLKDYQQLQPLYEVIYDGEDDLSQRRESAAEQIKALGQPFIPGSSIKGAIECALIYSFIKKHCKDCRKNIEAYLNEPKNARRPAKTTDNFYFEMLYGTEFVQENNKTLPELIKGVYSALQCSDIGFDQIEILDISREDVFKADNQTPLGLVECIPAGSKIFIHDPVQIDNYKKNRLLQKYPDLRMREMIRFFLDEKNILKALQEYTDDNLQSDQQDFMLDFFDEFPSLNQSFEHVLNEAKKSCSSKNSAVLRLGKNTSYFFKSISWLFRKSFPEFYYDQNIFDQFFKPKMTGKASKRKTNPETLPYTRVVGTNSDEAFLFGFVKVEVSESS